MLNLQGADVDLNGLASGNTVGLFNYGMSGADVSKMGIGIAQAVALQQQLEEAQQRMERERQTRLAMIVGGVVVVILFILLSFYLLSKPT